MITIFNRKSIWIGTDLQRFNQIRDRLEQEKIKYSYKTKNQMGQWADRGTVRGSMGSLGNSIDMMYEYEIFVRNTDFEKANYVIGNI